MNSIILEKGFVPSSLAEDSQALLVVRSLSAQDPFTRSSASPYSISILWQESTASQEIECLAYESYAEGESKRLKCIKDSKLPGFIIDWPKHFPEHLKQNFILHTDCHNFAENYDWTAFKGIANKSLISIPAFGSIAKQWKDGWLMHYAHNGQILSLVPPGSISRLSIPLNSDPNYRGLNWQEALQALPDALQRQHRCIVNMLGGSCLVNDLAKISIATFDLETAIRLLLIRQAFPTQKVKIYHSSPKKLWPARFKNFLNCLDIESVQSLEETNLIVLDHFFTKLGTYKLNVLAPLLNAKTRILAGL